MRALGYDLGLPAHLVERHPFPGPGLAIRILCAEEPYMEKDFAETQVGFLFFLVCERRLINKIVFQVIARVIVDYKNKFERKHALLARVTEATTDDEKKELMRISSSYEISATVLPIRTVGVQGEHH